MKTTKKILAALLAVMMLALMLPMTASAVGGGTSGTYSYSITTPSTAGYTFTIYQIADLDTKTGQYSAAASTAVETALAKGSDADLLTAADALTDEQLDGKNVRVFTNESNQVVTGTVNNAGVYYIKITGFPSGANVTRTSNSVLSLPYYNNGSWTNSYEFSVASKVEDDTPTVTKAFTNSNYSKQTSISEFINNKVDFTLTASVVGSTTEKVKSYVIADQMSKGLDFVDNSMQVKLTADGKDDRLLNDTEYTFTPQYTADEHNFTVTLSDSVISDDNFYGYSKVVVTYTAKLNNDAVIGSTGNPNSDKLQYTNSFGQESTIDGQTVTVYTFDLTVKKVDAAANETVLKDAGFTVYTDFDCKTVATNGSQQLTGDNGTVKFNGLKAGTYYVKETQAPANYNINSTVFPITIADDGDVSGTGVENNVLTVTDSKLVAPNTGGMGTAVFTICGASLVLLGGALLLITLKKRSAAK